MRVKRIILLKMFYWLHTNNMLHKNIKNVLKRFAMRAIRNPCLLKKHMELQQVKVVQMQQMQMLFKQLIMV